MKRIFILVPFLIASVVSTSQNNDDLNIFPNIVIPSPNAMALGNYGNIPVSNYTGLPNITIPLYTVHSGKIEVPITLSYHAKGIKVAQEATWVGLGWSLSSGGCISRKINSLDDFKSTNGYLDAEPLPDNQGWILPDYHGNYKYYDQGTFLDDYEQLENCFYGLEDAQPDDFNYSFCGYSGKLFFQKQNDQIVTALTADQTNLNFLYNRNLKQWEVTDEKGWKYFFGTQEISRSLTQGSNTFIKTPSGASSEEMITAWYLDRIITLDGDEVTFTYSQTGRWINSQASYNEMSQVGPFNQDFRVNTDPGIAESDIHGTRYYASITEINEVYPESITFNGGTVYFSTSNRLDRKKVLNASYAQKLDYIEISNISESFQKTIFFEYSYFREDKLNASDKDRYLRLKLTKVYETYPAEGIHYIALPPYEFQYNEVKELPPKDTLSMDHWGYYNGANSMEVQNYEFISLDHIEDEGGFDDYWKVNENITDAVSTLMPRYGHLGYYSGYDMHVFFNGADREVDTSFLKTGSLLSIKYPTGGITQFDFEPNDYYFTGIKKDTLFTVIVESISGDSIAVTAIPFPGAFVLLHFEMTNYCSGCSVNEDDMEGMIAKMNTDGTWNKILEFVPSDIYNPIPGMTSQICVYLPPGTYMLKANEALSNQHLILSLQADFFTQKACTRKFADGLRIRSIRNYQTEGGELLSSTSYDYDDSGHSSGKIMSQIENFYNETDLIATGLLGQGHTPCCFLGSLVPPIVVANFLIRWGTSLKPISSAARGNYIGYSKVIVTDQDKNGESLGKTVYQFFNVPDEQYGSFFPGMPGIMNLQNGQLTTKTEYSGSSEIKVKETVYAYETDPSADVNVVGFKCERPMTDYGEIDNDDLGIFARPYYLQSQWWHPASEITTTFSSDGSGNGVVTSKYFYYDNAAHKLLTREIIYQSDGSEMKKVYKFPLDVIDPDEIYSDPGTLQKLQADQMNFLLKTETYNDQLRINGQIRCPRLNTMTNSVVTGSVWNLETDNYHMKEEYDYRMFNRPVQHKIADDQPVVIIWGYNYSYPVARIVNATYDQVEAALGCSIEELQLKINPDDDDDIRDIFSQLREDLSEAFITSYTYKPLVGMTSETDPNGITTYYEYDGFGRLELIKDKDLNILKKIEYNHANQ